MIKSPNLNKEWTPQHWMHVPILDKYHWLPLVGQLTPKLSTSQYQSQSSKVSARPAKPLHSCTQTSHQLTLIVAPLPLCTRSAVTWTLSYGFYRILSALQELCMMCELWSPVYGQSLFPPINIKVAPLPLRLKVVGAWTLFQGLCRSLSAIPHCMLKVCNKCSKSFMPYLPSSHENKHPDHQEDEVMNVSRKPWIAS